MKAKRILSFSMILVLLVCLLPTVYVAAAEESSTYEEWTLEAELEDLGFTSDEITQRYVGLEDPGGYGVSTFGAEIVGKLMNCDAMNFTCNNGKTQGFHFADEDQDEPWDYMNMVYCLENKKSFSYGEDQSGSTDLPMDGTGTNHGENVWYGLTADQRVAVALIMLYGAPGKLWDYDWGINPVGDHNMHNPNIGYRFATQALIWEITAGLRDATYPYTRHSSYWYDVSVGQCTTEDGTVDHFVVAYESILNDLMLHNVIPSFTGDFAAAAPEILLTGGSTTIMDTNGVLDRFTFTDADGVTYSKNGDKLTITAAGSLPTGVQSAVAELPDPLASLYEVWFNPTDDSLQTCIKISVPASDPVPAYFKLKGSTGSLSLVKTTEDGKNLGGWRFGIYSDAACTKLFAGPYTTDSSGNMHVSDLAAGTYWVKEIGHYAPAINALYQCDSTNPQKVTITAGNTASVTFVNTLRPGCIEIQKVDTEGRPLAGVEFLLEWSQDGENWQPVTFTSAAVTQIGGCTSPGLEDGKLKSDANGAVSFEGLYPLLQYRLSETATLDGYQLLTGYAYVGGLSVENDFTVALTVVNARSFELPATGSRSLVLMPIALVLCLATCAGALVLLRKKEGR